MKPRCVELFAGGGGAALGLRAAGFSSLACVEADAAACRTLTGAGFPTVQGWIGTDPPAGVEIPCWPTDAGDVGLVAQGEEIDVVWASPPCQPWSMAGKQEGHSDSREGSAATIAALAALPLIAGGIATLTARFTVLRALRRMP